MEQPNEAEDEGGLSGSWGPCPGGIICAALEPRRDRTKGVVGVESEILLGRHGRYGRDDRRTGLLLGGDEHRTVDRADHHTERGILADSRGFTVGTGDPDPLA
jgi:hypothetical protein